MNLSESKAVLEKLETAILGIKMQLEAAGPQNGKSFATLTDEQQVKYFDWLHKLNKLQDIKKDIQYSLLRFERLYLELLK